MFTKPNQKRKKIVGAIVSDVFHLIACPFLPTAMIKWKSLKEGLINFSGDSDIWGTVDGDQKHLPNSKMF